MCYYYNIVMRKGRREPMSITKSIEAMRKIVCMYDKIQTKKDKIRNKAGKALSVMKGGNKMKFGTIIGIVVGAITLIAAGAAAMYVFLNGFPCCKNGCCVLEKLQTGRLVISMKIRFWISLTLHC